MVNMFLLSTFVEAIAEMYCDAHVGKILLEIIQMLYAALDIWGVESPPVLLDGQTLAPYKVTHSRHPVTLYIAGCKAHYLFALELAVALGRAFERRYKHPHKSAYHAVALLQSGAPDVMPDSIDVGQWSEWLRKLTIGGKPLDPLKIDDAVRKTGTINPPKGTQFGVMCFGVEGANKDDKQAMWLRLACPDENGRVDCVRAHRNYYEHKSTKFAMRWSKQDQPPSFVLTAIPNIRVVPLEPRAPPTAKKRRISEIKNV